MMGLFQYRCLGSEKKTGGRTEIPIGPVSGYEITNLFVNGAGVLIEPDYVSAAAPIASVPGLLSRGAIIIMLYKLLPRPTATAMTGYESSGYESSGYE